MDVTRFIQFEAGQLGPWAYLVLFLLVLIEGPIVTLLGAAAASTNVMVWQWVFATAAVANLTADVLWYLLGYAGRIDLIYRAGRWVGVGQHQLEHVEVQLRRNATRVLVIAKLTAGFVIPSLIGAGLLKIPWRRWFFPVVAAEMLWTGTLVFLGFHAVNWLQQIEQGLQIVAVAGSVAFILLTVYWVRKKIVD